MVLTKRVKWKKINKIKMLNQMKYAQIVQVILKKYKNHYGVRYTRVLTMKTDLVKPQYFGKELKKWSNK